MKRTLVLAWLLCAACGTTVAAERALRDPFARPMAPPSPQVVAAAAAAELAETPPLRLRAVILNGAHSLANIDGDIVGVGEQARDYTVVRIDARGVMVTRAGKRQLLTMNEKDKQ